VIVQEPPFELIVLFPDSEMKMLVEALPKELFEALIRLLRLRRSPPLYARIGERVSLRALKGEVALARIAAAIASWFPPASGEDRS
jgi:hypothetical protein